MSFLMGRSRRAFAIASIRPRWTLKKVLRAEKRKHNCIMKWRGMILVCAISCSALGAVPAAQFRSGPPWRHPVVSSQSFHIGGAVIQVDFGPGTLDLPHDQVMQWVRNSASSVATYYGRFPVTNDRV